MKTLTIQPRRSSWTSAVPFLAIFALLAASGCTGDDGDGGNGGNKNDTGAAVADGEDQDVDDVAEDVAEDVEDSGHGGCLADSDCAAFDDDNACNGVAVCDKATGVCETSPAVVCDKTGEDACNFNGCDPKSGTCSLLPRPDGTTCDDGDECTPDDGCKAGNCAGGANVCECKLPADCDAKEDGNKCNGTLFCDKSAVPYVCKLNAGTVVECDVTEDTACKTTTCNKDTGLCAFGPVNDGAECDWDGNACTVDLCKAGECEQGSVGKGCDCKKDGDCDKLEDGNDCNGTLFCNLANLACELNPATKINCPNFLDAACSSTSCNPKNGKCEVTTSKDDTACADGVPCTGKEACKGGLCEAVELTCGCTQTADCASVDDDDQCNGALYCDLVVNKCRTNPATIRDCSKAAKTACTDASCVPKTGKCVSEPANDGTVCEADGTFCTGLDLCKDGKCEMGKPKCACTATADCAAFDDANLCNGSLYCDVAKGHCLVNPTTVVSCVGGTDCQPIACDETSGKCGPSVANDGADCDADGFSCTADLCAKGECTAGPNQCLCGADEECKQWEDGDACNGTLHCDSAAKPSAGCAVDPTTVVTCAASLPGECTASYCDPKDGKCNVGPGNDKAKCDDGQLCTEADACAAGSCVGLAAAATKACDDANACTAPDLCSGGGCKAGNAVVCDDKVACTNDSCDPEAGCVSVINHTLCSDGIACTDDTCDAVKGCQATADDGKCDDNIGCTVDRCDEKGCVFLPNSATCSDNDTCNGVETCDVKTGCLAGKALNCDDGNSCTDDACDANAGCASENNTKPCDADQSACTSADTCAFGACKAGAQQLSTRGYGAGALHGVAATKTGFVAVGNEGTGASSKPYFAVLGKDGLKLAEASLAAGAGHTFHGVAKVGSSWMAVGEQKVESNTSAVVSQFSDAGKLVGTPQAVKASGTHALEAIVSVGSKAIAVGWRNTSQFPSAWVVALTDTGVSSRDYILGNDGPSMLKDVDVLTSGEYIAVGEDTTDGATILVVRGDAAGKVNAQRFLTTQTKSGQYATSVFALPDGGAWIGGGIGHSTGAGDGVLVRIDAALNATHSAKIVGTGAVEVADIAVVGTRLVTLSTRSAAGKSTGKLDFFTLVGIPIAAGPELQLSGSGIIEGNAFAADSSGLLVVASAGTGATQNRASARTDHYGNSSCAASDKCFALGTSCLKGAECATETCSPKTGCASNALSQSTACDDGAVCTNAAKCDDKGKCVGVDLLWSTGLNDREINDVTYTESKHIVVVGLDHSKQSPLMWRATFDPATTKIVHEYSAVSQFGGSQANAVAAHSGQQVVIAGKQDGYGDIATLWRLGALSKTPQMKTTGGGELFDVVVFKGKIVTVGQTPTFQNPGSGMLRVTQDMMAWVLSKDFDGSKYGDFHAVLAFDDGYLIAGTRVNQAKQARATLLRTNATGQVLSFNVQSKASVFGALAALPDGRVAAVGQDGQDAAKLKVLFQIAGNRGANGLTPAASGFAGALRGHSVAVNDEGRVLIVGHLGKTLDGTLGDSNGLDLMYDAGGVLVGAYQDKAANRVHTGAAWIPGRGWVVAGYSFANEKYAGHVQILDRFLNAGCPDSGDCMLTTFGACDDGKPCTRDGCTKGACGNNVVGDGGACDDGAKCALAGCKSGSCAPSALAIADCDDKSACTLDTCDSKSGCKHADKAGSCDDGDPCTTADTCDKGICSGRAGFFDQKFGHATTATLESPSLHGIARHADGRIFLVGADGSEGVNGLAILTDALGNRKFLTEYNPPDGQDMYLNAAFVAHDNAGWMAIGYGGNQSHDGYFVVFNDAGGVKSTQKYSPGGSFTRLNNAVQLSDGYAVVGEFDETESEKVLFARVDKVGKELWRKSFKANSPTASSVVVTPGGASFAVGFGRRNFVNQGFVRQRGLMLVPNDKTKTPTTKIFSDQVTTSVVALNNRTDGHYSLFSNQTSNGSRPHLSVVSAAFAEKWETSKGDWDGQWFAAIPTSSDGFIAVGRISAGKGAYKSAIGGFDLWGNELWREVATDTAGNEDRYSALVADGDGLIVAGIDTSINDHKIRVRRMSWWGKGTCNDAKSCENVLPKTCDDSNPCSQSVCTSGKGCEHKAFPEFKAKCELKGEVSNSNACDGNKTCVVAG